MADILRTIVSNVVSEVINISIQVSLKFGPWGLFDNKAAVVQVIITWQLGKEALLKPIMTQINHSGLVTPYGDKLAQHRLR